MGVRFRKPQLCEFVVIRVQYLQEANDHVCWYDMTIYDHLQKIQNDEQRIAISLRLRTSLRVGTVLTWFVSCVAGSTEGKVGLRDGKIEIKLLLPAGSVMSEK